MVPTAFMTVPSVGEDRLESGQRRSLQQRTTSEIACRMLTTNVKRDVTKFEIYYKQLIL